MSHNTMPGYVPIQLEGLDLELTPSSLQSFLPAGVSDQRFACDGFRGSVNDIWASVFVDPGDSVIRVPREQRSSCLLELREFPGIFGAFAQK